MGDDELDDSADLAPREPSDREDLLADLHERLDDDDAAGRAAAPTGQAVADIHRDLDRFSDAGGKTRPAGDNERAAPGSAPPGRAAMPP